MDKCKVIAMDVFQAKNEISSKEKYLCFQAHLKTEKEDRKLD